ncbi:hypothetical protein C0993_000734 [Termitomyces sp. T159_Od127]|nr:hypothetical protein C0993_000734 [Termitomyces sp. T159_Od127]
MKPYWRAGSSYDWAEMENGSRLGAQTIKHEEGVGYPNAQGLDFSKESIVVDESEDQPDGVDVNEYGDEIKDVEDEDLTDTDTEGDLDMVTVD